MRTISQVNVNDKCVLLRADLDVPIQDNQVVDDFRLQALLPTLGFLLSRARMVTVVGHRGRPGGRYQAKFSLQPVFNRLQGLLEKEGVPNLSRLRLGQNLRFDPREEENNSDLAQELALGQDLFVNEAFAASHRMHASIVGVAKLLPAYAGLHLAEEVKHLTEVRDQPRRPLVFIVGGGKTDKVKYVRVFSRWADKILLGGVLMFARELEGVAKVLFPIDAVGTEDIGPKSVRLFCQELAEAKTVVWNGPLGKFEEERFAFGTRQIGQFLVDRVGARTTKVIVGGGDTLAALKVFNLRDRIGFVSTGGGAMLEYLAEGTLPGLEALL